MSMAVSKLTVVQTYGGELNRKKGIRKDLTLSLEAQQRGFC